MNEQLKTQINSVMLVSAKIPFLFLLAGSLVIAGCINPSANSLDYYLDHKSELESLLTKAQQVQPSLPYHNFALCIFQDETNAIKVILVDSGSVSYIVDAETGSASRCPLYRNQNADWMKQIDSLVNSDNMRQLSKEYFNLMDNDVMYIGPDGISITVGQADPGYYRRSDYGLFIKYPDFPADSLGRNRQTRTFEKLEIAPGIYHTHIEVLDEFLEPCR